MFFHASEIEILELIAYYEAQQEYAKNAPIANIPAELVYLWFDDFYFRTQQFEKEFSTIELAALSDFYTYYDVRVERLPKSNEGLAALQKNKYWKEISEQAKATLLKLKIKNT